MKETRGAPRRRFIVSPLATAVAAAIGSCGVEALAQQSGPALEEIIVTASRRETTVQELPFNISAVSGETLERQRLTSLSEFSRWVPGLTVVDQGVRGGNLMTVRGLNVLSLNASEFLDNGSGGTVQTYLGDIPLYLDLKMHDIERVEVLIGPQGTLYGAGTLGGAVRYIPRAPDTEAFSLDLHGDLYAVEHSDGTGYQADAAVNVPLVQDRLALRASVAYVDDPGFIDYPYVLREPGVSNPQPDFSDPAEVAANLRRVDDANFEQTLSGRVALSWEASERVQATLNYYFQDQEAGARTINHREAFGTGRYESAHRYLEPNDRENALLSLDVVADLGFAELTWAAGASRYDEQGQRDQTDLLLDFEYGYEDFPAFSAYTREIVEEERVNHEIRLVSTGTGPWSWIGGLFYNDYTVDASSEEFTPGFPAFIGLDLPTGDLEYLQLTDAEQTEQAVFGEVSYRFDDRWAVTLGGRFFEYELTQSVSFDLPIVGAFGIADPPVLAEDDGFLGKLNVAYDFSDSSLAYLTVSEGYRVGGANPIEQCSDDLDPAQQNVCALPDERLIDPDTTTNYEIGVHSTIADGRVNLNGALFYIDWQDIQTMSTTQNGNVPITVNGGGARSRGAELSLQAETAGPWSFTASYAYADAQLTTDAPGLVDGDDAFAGDRLAGTPQHQGSFYANYNRSLANGWDLDVSYGLTFTSDYLTKVGMRGGGERLGGYTLHSATVGVGQDRWSATLYADNLLDKFAETGVRLDPSYVRDVGGFTMRRYFRNVLRPRTVGIEFRYRL
ncbi:MAG: TonB-dependent receptor [Gammaproteobacteria bacterium]|nr:TonB-dependent receptor [Gammaproteobacteria bacterium]